MEDAIDDWLLRQIHWLRSEETIAQGIRWVQDVRTKNAVVTAFSCKDVQCVQHLYYLEMREYD